MQNMRWIGLAVFIIILLVAGFAGFKYKKSSVMINKNKRQTVFLSTGQVYFGYMGDPNAEYVSLKDPFYPQTEQTSSNARRNVTLVPLSENYTTENIIYINRKQILHFENLADDSKINSAIESFKNNPSSPAPVTSPIPSPTSSPLSSGTP